MKYILNRFCLFFVVITVFSQLLPAQRSLPDVIQAQRITQKIVFDGHLNDTVWQTVPRISNFTQREPNFGNPVSEQTETAILYDETALYIGVWCYQSENGKITAKYMNRDFEYENEDNFQIIISPFNDKRNGYMFVINPNGARADLMVYGGEEGNMDWNGVWDVKTSITYQGWFAEIVIPFSTLQFKKSDVQRWAINFQRNIAFKNEQALWQGWSRDFSIFAVVNAGSLEGLTQISYSQRFELKPYVLTGREWERDRKANYPFKFGADLNVNLSPTLKLNVTSMTDFAQVEADRIAVNLSRFNLYYPEKREFFLESYNLYQFGLGNSNNVYYTRKIGIEHGQPVPILAGARLFGKVGRNNIGFLTIQEGKVDTIPTTNATVARYKRDIGEQSFIGGIVTNKINALGSNTIVGIDGSYETSQFLKDKNLVIYGNVALCSNDYKLSKNALAYRFFIDYPNDLIDNFMSISSVQEHFNPELGYLRRGNYEAANWTLRITPRWFSSLGVQRMQFKPWEVSVFRTFTTKEIESFFNETRPFGFELQNGGAAEFNLQLYYERIDEAYDVEDGFTIDKGKYTMFRYEFQFETSPKKRIWLSAGYNWGGFFDGTIHTLENELGININSHFNIKNEYTLNKIRLNGAQIYVHELANYLHYAFTTKLNVSLFSQWNSLDDFIFFNLRLHWIPKVGSDVYVVYNQGHDDIGRFQFFRPKQTTGVIKIDYRFTF